MSRAQLQGQTGDLQMDRLSVLMWDMGDSCDTIPEEQSGRKSCITSSATDCEQSKTHQRLSGGHRLRRSVCAEFR